VLTLDAVLEAGEAKSEALAITQAGVRRSDADKLRVRAALLPQLNATASYDRTLATEFANLFNTTSTAPTCPGFSLDQSASLDARVAEIERAIHCGAVGAASNPFGSRGASSLPFGRANAWRINLAFSQSLYSGGRVQAQQALAQAGADGASLQVSTARAQLLFQLTQAYYDVALTERLVEIAQATIEQSEATLRQTEAAFRAGAQPEFDVLRARVGRDSQMPLLIRQRANREIALLRLKQMLEVPAEAELHVAESLSDEMLPPPRVFADRVVPVEGAIQAATLAQAVGVSTASVPERTVVRQATNAVDLSTQSLRAALAERKPTVAVQSTFGTVNYRLGPNPLDFRNNWTVGVAMQVPILNGGRVAASAAMAQADVDAARVRLKQSQELADLDSRSAWAELVAARAAWESTSGTVQQAARAYEIADVRYRNGVSTQLELSDARLLLQQAQANRAQAARDLQVARARIALLPDLPLGTVGGVAAATATAAQAQAATQGAGTAAAAQGGRQ
jgi:outer membrane protein TolC